MSGRPYSEVFKDRMVQRMSMPGGPCAMDLSRETNVPQPTLSRWLRAARNVTTMAKRQRPTGEVPAAPSGTSPERPERDAKSVREWTPIEKVRVVAAAEGLKDEELGAFLRREGLHLAQLEEWRAEIVTALGAPAPKGKNPDARRVRELEREVARKDKALAEVTALLVLQKKLDALFGSSAEEGDSTDEDNEKK
jgi:transposase-like protein